MSTTRTNRISLLRLYREPLHYRTALALSGLALLTSVQMRAEVYCVLYEVISVTQTGRSVQNSRVGSDRNVGP